MRWRSVYRNPPRSLPLLFPLLSYRKHALNCHRMKPALFSVLCEIKEKTGEFLLHTFSLCSPVCIGCNLVLRCTAFAPLSVGPSYFFIGLAENYIDYICSRIDKTACIVYTFTFTIIQSNRLYCLLFGKIIIET